jgi:IS5 family transposase
MKARIGVDAGSGMARGVETTAANVSDIEVARKLIRGDDERAKGDAGYAGLEKREEIRSGEHLSKIE